MAFIDNDEGGRVIKQGINPVKITLTDTCNVGDLIGFDGIVGRDNVWKRADADGKIMADLVAGEKCETSGDEITCYRIAVVAVPPPYADPIVPTAATPGKPVYLSDSPGEYADNPEGIWSQAVGMFISVNEMFVVPNTIPASFYAVHAVQGTFIRTEIDALVAAEDVLYGLRIDLKTIATSIIGDAYGLLVFGQMQEAPAWSSALVRIEDGCANSCGFDSYIWFVTGLDDPPDFLFKLGSIAEPTNNAWSLTTDSSETKAGRIKIEVAGSTRYISIYSD